MLYESQNKIELNAENILNKSNDLNRQIIFVKKGVFATIGEGEFKVVVNAVKPFSYTMMNGKVDSVSNVENALFIETNGTSKISVDFLKTIATKPNFFAETVSKTVNPKQDSLGFGALTKKEEIQNFFLLKLADVLIKNNAFDKAKYILSKTY